MPTLRNAIESVLRHESCYRTTGPLGGEARWGCGFGLKPDRGGYSDRATRDYVIVYVLRGQGRFSVDGSAFPVQAGDACQHAPGHIHSLEPEYDGQWAEVFLSMDGPLYTRLGELGLVDPGRPVLRPGLDAGLVERFEQILRDLAALPDSELGQTVVRCQGLLVQVHRLARGAGGAARHARRVDTACLLLAEADGLRLSLPEIADHLHMSYDRFRRLFTAQMGIPPGEYRIRRRIDRARELILHQALSNKEVAARLGYPDPFSFSKQFKRVVGESPAAFRQRML